MPITLEQLNELYVQTFHNRMRELFNQTNALYANLDSNSTSYYSRFNNSFNHVLNPGVTPEDTKVDFDE